MKSWHFWGAAIVCLFAVPYTLLAIPAASFFKTLMVIYPCSLGLLSFVESASDRWAF